MPKYKRLYPDGPECRLKGAYLIRCTGCVKDENGSVTEVLAEYDPDSRGGDPADGRKVKGCHHPLGGRRHRRGRGGAAVRQPVHRRRTRTPADKNFLDCLNPNSLEVLTGCKVEAGPWRMPQLPPASSSCAWATSAWTARTPSPAIWCSTDL